MGSLSTPALVLVFVAGSGFTWAAGTVLSKTTDALDARLRLGADLGGLILLAIAGSLPELAITVSAAASGNLGLAAGNLIGGIAMQTMVLVICDVASGPQPPLTYLIGRLTPVLEGLLVMNVVAFALMGALLAPRYAIGGVVSPASIAIVVVWLGGLFIINREGKAPHWKVEMPGSSPGRRHRREPHPEKAPPYGKRSTAVVGAFFGAACLVTLAAGVALEESGNAFQLCLFLLADIIAVRPVLPYAGDTNAWLGALGIALTAIYCFGMISRPARAHLRIGPDSWLAVVVFGLGIAGMFALR